MSEIIVPVGDRLRGMIDRGEISIGAPPPANPVPAAQPETRPEITVIDVLLPSETGSEIIARIRSRGAGGEPLVLITAGDLDELIEDRLAEAAFERTRGQETVPAAVVDRLLAGDSPVTVWREHRGLTLRALADKAGLSPGYLSQIENGTRQGPIATMKKLAAALDTDLDDLI